MSPRTDTDDQKDSFPHIPLNSMLALKMFPIVRDVLQWSVLSYNAQAMGLMLSTASLTTKTPLFFLGSQLYNIWKTHIQSIQYNPLHLSITPWAPWSHPTHYKAEGQTEHQGGHEDLTGSARLQWQHTSLKRTDGKVQCKRGKVNHTTKKAIFY